MNESTLPPHVQLVEMTVWAHHKCSILHTAVKLDLADHIGDKALTAETLAQLTGTQPGPLYRFLRTLRGIGILQKDQHNRFALTELGAALKRGAPGAARSAIYMLGITPSLRAWESLEQTLKTGETAFVAANGESFFDYIRQHPDQVAMFSETMVALNDAEPPAIASAYDFARFHTIVDVGGATGSLLAAILNQHPGPRAVLSDLPDVVATAPGVLQQLGVAPRVSIEACNFFEAVPTGGDAYLLSHVIHDWDEERSLQILRNCRSAMTADATLLLVEMVLTDVNASNNMGTLVDISMLVYAGGQERTEQEYRDLLARAGFALQRVIPTACNSSILEARPA